MENKELKPCPFCGGKAEFIHNGEDKYIGCNKCNSRTRCSYSLDELAELWNTRHTLQPKVSDKEIRKELTYRIAGMCINDRSTENAVNSIVEWYRDGGYACNTTRRDKLVEALVKVDNLAKKACSLMESSQRLNAIHEITHRALSGAETNKED